MFLIVMILLLSAKRQLLSLPKELREIACKGIGVTIIAPVILDL